MTRALGVMLLGFLAVVVQGALAVVIAPPWCPDLALLVVLGIGLRWNSMASGLIIVTLLGYVADVLSGGLRGGHALLRLFVFVSARLATRQLDLRGAIPLAGFAAVVSVLYGVAAVGLMQFLTGASSPAWGWIDLLPHAIVNALAAPAVDAAVRRVMGWLGDDEDARQLMSLEPGSGAS